MSIKLTDKIESVAKAGIIVDALQVSGGYIVVDTSLAEIKQQSIKIGTKAYITSENKEYRYTRNGWSECITEAQIPGTKTYTSVADAEEDLSKSNLSQGQIITVVDEDIADAYIVGYNCSELVKISGGIYPINTEDIDLILSGTYSKDASETQKDIIDNIIAGSYLEG